MTNKQGIDPKLLDDVMRRAKKVAKEYRHLTGRPLGVTGEVAEYEAAKILGLRLAPARQDGFDAIRGKGSTECRVQIKARCVLETSKPGQRVGGIKLGKPWDIVLLVILDGDLEVISIYEAVRAEITAALLAPGSKARNERGAMSVSKFKSIGKMIWNRNPPHRIPNVIPASK